MRFLASLICCSGLLMSQLSWAACGNGSDFAPWLDGFKQRAAQAGISPSVINSALKGVQYDPNIIQRDRSQAVFAQDFLTFAGKKVSASRINQGRAALQANKKLLNRIENQYGVPGAVLAAFWGLETDFGAVTGNSSTLSSLATLAYDCRRPERFNNELMHALWLIQKGDQTPATMRGAWAGELGQLQFIPSGYDLQGVDYDGDGKRDLIRSKADALASGANLLRHYGWQAGQPWLVEVRVPKDMDWSQARLNNKLPLSQWAAQGVTYPDGAALRKNGVAALLLPMGRNGPAFLAYPNFDAYMQWNESSVYSTTAAYMATRLAGAPALHRGNAPVATLSMAQARDLQRKLQARGFNVGKIDGIIGENTRSAVRKVQQQLGLPADSYPDAVLLQKL